MMFWSLSNLTFDPEQGSRLYGLVGGGGVAGAMVGSLLTNRLAGGLVSTEHLLLISAALLAPTAYLARLLERYTREGSMEWTRDEREARAGGDADPQARRSGLWIVLADRYVGSMALLVFLFTAVGTIFDYQFSHIVRDAVTSKDARTAYFGGVFFAVNVLALAIQLIVTGPVQTAMGPAPGLLSVPVAAAIGTLALYAWPVLSVATVIGVAGQALTYSIHQASKELLYLPTGASVKVRAKAFIDTFVFRAGDAGASVALLAWGRIELVKTLGIASPRFLFLMVVPMTLLWAVVARGLAREWQSRVRD
jgi:AAA family ATP:ADP antiporter